MSDARWEILRPEYCPDCGSDRFIEQFLSVQHQQVARLVERPIEVVEYQRQTCQCAQCGQRVSAPHPSDGCARTGSEYWVTGIANMVR